ncbi:MAG: hypothetical protein ACR2LY_00530 [Thermoleophilaceae bacterium]
MSSPVEPPAPSARGAAVAAAVAGLAAGVLALLVGFLAAAVFGDESLVGGVGEDVGVAVEAFRQVVQFLLVEVFEASLPGDPARTAPALLLTVPVGSCAIAAAAAASRTRGMAGWQRTLWGAAVGLPFALMVLICVLLAGSDDDFMPSTRSAVGTGLLWGALGGAVGAALIARGDRRVGAPVGAEAPGPEGSSVPHALGAAADVLRRALRPLAVLLAVAAVIGAAAWVVRTFSETESFAEDRSTAVAALESAMYAVEHGVHLVELGLFVEFEPPAVDLEFLGFPVPPSDPEDVAASLERYRITAYREALPGYLFVALLVTAVGLPLVFALFAGFDVARGRRTASRGLGAAWGAVVGPAWALVMTLLDGLIDKPVFGQPVPGSVFATFLLVGTVVGALGGFLAAPRRSGPPAT